MKKSLLGKLLEILFWHMETYLMKKRVRPYKGRWCTRKQAKRMNDLLKNATKPDRTALEQEAEEFARILRERRKKKGLNEEKL